MANQVRYFAKSLEQPGLVSTIDLESYHGIVAPTTVAITAELPSGKTGSTASTPTPAAANRAGALKVVIAGGGSSHDYDRWFDRYDTALLAEGGFAKATYSDKPSELPALLKDADVLYQSANHEMAPEARQAIFDFVESGKGLVIVHAGLWYNWKDWPKYNLELCGGGSRGHDRYGTFDVKITGEHPILEGVPSEFTIDDELYYFEPAEGGMPIEILATAHSKQRDKTYPMVMIVKHPKARIVSITLGHDGAAHEHPAFQRLLRNALAWVAER
jgi:type 1 glutamine amidotransferase